MDCGYPASYRHGDEVESACAAETGNENAKRTVSAHAVGVVEEYKKGNEKPRGDEVEETGTENGSENAVRVTV